MFLRSTCRHLLAYCQNLLQIFFPKPLWYFRQVLLLGLLNNVMKVLSKFNESVSVPQYNFVFLSPPFLTIFSILSCIFKAAWINTLQSVIVKIVLNFLFTMTIHKPWLYIISHRPLNLCTEYFNEKGDVSIKLNIN